MLIDPSIKTMLADLETAKGIVANGISWKNPVPVKAVKSSTIGLPIARTVPKEDDLVLPPLAPVPLASYSTPLIISLPNPAAKKRKKHLKKANAEEEFVASIMTTRGNRQDYTPYLDEDAFGLSSEDDMYKPGESDDSCDDEPAKRTKN